MHKSHEELAEEIIEIASLVALSGIYAHFKTGNRYVVRGFVVDEATEVVCVRYSSIDDDTLEYSRPVSSWLEEVDGVTRFKQLDV